MFLTGRFRRRSWGWYLVLLNRNSFKVKLLRFAPNKAMSIQHHLRRNELWLFLRGFGKFNGLFIESGKWRNILKTEIHTFTAIKPTWVLEIQYGDKCIEEDIIRA